MSRRTAPQGRDSNSGPGSAADRERDDLRAILHYGRVANVENSNTGTGTGTTPSDGVEGAEGAATVAMLLSDLVFSERTWHRVLSAEKLRRALNADSPGPEHHLADYFTMHCSGGGTHSNGGDMHSRMDLIRGLV